MGESLGFLTEDFASSGPAAPPSFGSIGTYFSPGSNTSTPSLAVPSGVAANDILLAVFYTETLNLTISSFPSGFAYHPDMPYTATTGVNQKMIVAWKRATAADSGSYAFTMSASSFMEGIVVRYTNCKTTGTPFDAKSVTDTVIAENASNSNNSPAVNVTSLGPNRKFIHIPTNWGGNTWTASASPAYTKRVQGGFGLFTVCDRDQATAANSGSVVASCADNDKSSAFITALIGN